LPADNSLASMPAVLEIRRCQRTHTCRYCELATTVRLTLRVLSAWRLGRQVVLRRVPNEMKRANEM